MSLEMVMNNKPCCLQLILQNEFIVWATQDVILLVIFTIAPIFSKIYKLNFKGN